MSAAPSVHIVYDPDAEQPVYAAMTTANVNDLTAAKAMPIAKGATGRTASANRGMSAPISA